MDLKAPWVKIVLFVAAVVFLGFGAAHVAWSGPSAEDTELRRVVLEEVAVAVLDKGTATTDNGKLIENLNEDYRSQSKGKADAPPSEPKPDAEDPEFEWVEEDVIEYVDKDGMCYFLCWHCSHTRVVASAAAGAPSTKIHTQNGCTKTS